MIDAQFFFNGQPVPQPVDFQDLYTEIPGIDVLVPPKFIQEPISFTVEIKPPVIIDVEYREVEDECVDE